MNFYKSKPWIYRREATLKRDGYQCQECKRYGKTEAATTVHHIIPLLWCLIHDKSLALNPLNLVSLCSKCHNKMHDRDSDKLTKPGIEWVRRLGNKGIEWLDKYSKDF